jgi:hypothetical protein
MAVLSCFLDFFYSLNAVHQPQGKSGQNENQQELIPVGWMLLLGPSVI